MSQKGIHGHIKRKTLCKRASVFFGNVTVKSGLASEKEVFLVCSDMKILKMKSAAYVRGVSEVKYAKLISDLLQADLESFGLKVGKPVPNGFGGYTFLVCC